MGVTISTHNRSEIAYGHNIRDPKIVSKESHIDLKRPHEIWHDEKIDDAYHRIFGAAVDRYNEKQRRADRKITNYLADIKKDAKKHPAYEMIIGIYGSDCSAEMGKEIMREFVDSWRQRNPNLEMIGAYYHADEQGEPHVHIDYIPVAHGYKRGMDTQNGLVKALEEQGIEGGETMKETAQILWEKRENAYLEDLCAARGLTVEHPGSGKKHLDTAEYKDLMNELHKAKEQLENTSKEQEKALAGVQEARRDCYRWKDRSKEAHKDFQRVTEELQERRETAEELDAFIEGSRDVIRALDEQIEQRQDDLRDLETVKREIDRLTSVKADLTADITEKLAEQERLSAALDDVNAKILTADEVLENTEAKILAVNEEIEIRERAVKRMDAAVSQEGMSKEEWNDKIAKERVALQKEKRLDLFEKFIQLVPEARKLWEWFNSQFEKSRGRSVGSMERK